MSVREVKLNFDLVDWGKTQTKYRSESQNNICIFKNDEYEYKYYYLEFKRLFKYNLWEIFGPNIRWKEKGNEFNCFLNYNMKMLYIIFIIFHTMHKKLILVEQHLLLKTKI